MNRRSFLMMLGLAPIAPAVANIAPSAEVAAMSVDKLNVMSLSEISRTLGSVVISNAVISPYSITCPKICAEAITAGPEWYRKLAENPIRSDRIHKSAINNKKLA